MTGLRSNADLALMAFALGAGSLAYAAQARRNPQLIPELSFLPRRAEGPVGTGVHPVAADAGH